MKNLPVSVSTFRKMIVGNYIYIDKTKYLYELVKNPSGVYFLSRPRRFGKSLLVSTLYEIFSGNKELFKELWIYKSEYDWEKYPIINIDFSKLKAETTEELKELINLTLKNIGREYDIELEETIYTARLDELMYKMNKKYNKQIVILIDEYDKPIIDYITDVETAVKMREILKGFYTIIKGNDEYVRFVLLTGVSKFGKAGVFSGLNNLEDITMVERYSTMLGITTEEMERYFEEYIEELGNKEGMSKEEVKEKIKEWYDGYCFSKECGRVYNPFSTLRLLKDKDFVNYWFESGTPSFLIKLIREKNFDVNSIPVEAVESLFTIYEVDRLEVIPLLFQTGYLTIKGYDRESNIYTLDYPNKEVKASFTEILIREFSSNKINTANVNKLIVYLNRGDIEEFFKIMKVIMAQIPYDIQIRKERYYQSIFYLIFQLIGASIEAEVRTDRGRIDAVVKTKERVYIFEFKINGKAKDAIEQIKEKRYYEKYEGDGREILLLGVGFDIEKEDGYFEFLYERI